MIEFRYRSGKPDAARASCYDCAHCKGAVSLWCKNPEAVAYRRTNIPGVHGCSYWSPMLPAAPEPKTFRERMRRLFVNPDAGCVVVDL